MLPDGKDVSRGSYLLGRLVCLPAAYSATLMVLSGLCDSCLLQRIVRTGRGSEFSMCLRHRDDPRYPKYPRIPVGACPGYVPRAERPE